MEMEEFALTLLGNYVFPIAMCILLFWYMTKQLESHKAETDALKDAVNELRVAITTLSERLASHDGK